MSNRPYKRWYLVLGRFHISFGFPALLEVCWTDYFTMAAGIERGEPSP